MLVFQYLSLTQNSIADRDHLCITHNANDAMPFLQILRSVDKKKDRNRKAEVFSIVSDVLRTQRELWRDFHITEREVVDYPTEIQNI